MKGAYWLVKKITENHLFALVDQRELYFVILIDDRFFYIEKGRIYRFESHHNMKLLDSFDDFQVGKTAEMTFLHELKQTLLKQIQYDWLTDIMTETFFEQVHKNQEALFIFTL